jgi:hypothetical protein
VENLDKIENKVKEAVAEYLEKNHFNTHVPYHIMAERESKQHVINIGTSIMLNKLGYDTHPGSFVRAVLNNSLQDAVGCADRTNLQVLPFYATMIYNLSVDLKDLQDE